MPTLILAASNPANSLISTGPDGCGLERLHEHGVMLVRGAFSETEMALVRERIELVIRRSSRDKWQVMTHPRYPGRTVLGDLLGMEELRDLDYIIFNPRVVSYAMKVLGDDIIYFGDSCIRTGNGGRGFHKDFQEETHAAAPMVRFALYLQDHEHHSGGLKVRIGSQRWFSRHTGQMMNVCSRTGDLVIFDLRVAHTGNNVRLRDMPDLCLHPKVENLVPNSQTIPEERDRIVLLWTFSRPGNHLDSYIEWITRSHEHWTRSAWSLRLVELARSRGAAMLRSTEDQGSMLAGDVRA